MSKDLTKIGANIRNYIDLNKELNLHKIGVLSYKTQPTNVSRNGQWITPASKSLKLSPFSNEGVSAVDNEFQEAQSIILEGLTKKGFYKIPNLGYFHQIGEEIEFIEEKSNACEYNYGLPSIQVTKLTPTLDKLKSKGKKHPNSSALQIERKKDRNFLIGTAMAALILILSVFTHYQIYNTESVSSENLLTESLDIDKSRLNHSPVSLLTNSVNEPELIPGIIQEEEVAKCALIVGSFSRKKNAIEMQQKVLEAGFDLYTEEFHEFYRVGISIDCSDVKGSSFLSVEKAIGVDPWLRISL